MENINGSNAVNGKYIVIGNTKYEHKIRISIALQYILNAIPGL